MSLKSRLLESLPFAKGELELLIMSAPSRYKVYEIPKREAGKFREVSQPTPEVKLLQRWLVKNELKSLPIHRSAKAYVSDVGLVENVRPHANNRYLLKIDFVDFFPSINSGNFYTFMLAHGFEEQDVQVMIRILFKYNKRRNSLQLAIGAPSSPLLSNAMLFSLDEAIFQACDGLGIVYTRYADDLSFSTNTPGILGDFFKNLPTIIAENCFVKLKINAEKTIHASKGRGRRITGLVITTDGKISIGAERKRLLRSQIYRYQKDLLDQKEIESVRGYVAFLESVEPEHILRLISRYGSDLMSRLYPPCGRQLVVLSNRHHLPLER
jgi:RNA-directed DNA polymerase